MFELTGVKGEIQNRTEQEKKMFFSRRSSALVTNVERLENE